MRRISVPLFVLALVIFGSSAFAEKAPMSPAALRKTATHVVVGKVNAVYERKKKDGNWSYTHRVAEIKVEKSEKGDGLKSGDLVYARYWTRRWSGWGMQPPSTSGHSGLPKEGQTLRVYLAKNAYDGFTNENKDGGFNVIGANGFESVKKGG